MLTLKSQEFRKGREYSWLDLEHLVSTAEAKGIRSLAANDSQRFPLLYRSVLSSLSVARSIALDKALVDYLDNLSLRSFLCMYSQPLSLLSSASHFLRRLLPQTVRSLRGHFTIVVLVLLLGIVSGYGLVNVDEGWYPVLVPAGLAGGRGPASTRQELLKLITKGQTAETPLLEFANILFSHNTLVGLLTFGLGFMAGVPTLLLILANGLVIGAIVALHVHRGLGVEFLAWLSIHGVTEMTSFVLFGVAGLRLGEVILFPRRQSRSAALASAAPAIANLAVGGAFMLLIAALLEGVLRQTITDTTVRLGIALGTLLLWSIYFAVIGRTSEQEGSKP